MLTVQVRIILKFFYIVRIIMINIWYIINRIKVYSYLSFYNKRNKVKNYRSNYVN